MSKIIVISGANLFSGGPLSIIQDCLKHLDKELGTKYRVIALVHSVKDFEGYQHIEFREITEMRKSYFHRLYYEYIAYKKISIALKPYLWLSLNDISSNIIAERRAVYCHNPSPFKKLVLSDIVNQTPVFFFTLFYKFLYRINIHENDYVIVQQNWIKQRFIEMFNLKPEKIITAPPQIAPVQINADRKRDSAFTHFCFPTFPRPFKNIEVIGKAVQILSTKGINNFKVTITIDGSENGYSKKILDDYGALKQFHFIGKITRNEVFGLYAESDCLIFPSTLETWGLPISEFKTLERPILLADLPYAHETLGNYDKGVFFDPLNANDLALKMEKIINHTTKFVAHQNVEAQKPLASNWGEVFNLLLEN